MIAEETGRSPEAIHRTISGRLRGSNAWTDYAKYLKANLAEELQRLPEGTNYDSM